MNTIFSTNPISKPLKSIRPGDKMYKIDNGFIICDRASIEISNKCPQQVANMIAQAYQNGWINAVAHVTEKEYTLLGLSQ